MGLLTGRIETELSHVEASIADGIRRAHLVKQVARILLGAAVSVAMTLSGGAGPWDLKAIVPIAAAALWTQLRAAAPSVPWDVVSDWLDLPVKTPPAPPAPPATTPGGGSGQ